MKKIINGKIYNTKTAEMVVAYDNGLGNRDFKGYSEELYRTKKGAWFLSGEGGPMTKYSRACGNMTSGGSNIILLSAEEAREWLERRDETDVIEEYFSSEIEEA